MTTQTEALKLALETAFDLGQQFKLQCEQARWHKGQRELADKTKLVFKQFVENTIKEALAQPTSSDYALGYSIGFGEGHSAGKALAQPEQEKERCVGCEACIDTACGRDECPKGWPKAAQPEQEPVATLDDLEQEIYENTRQFVSRDVMEWMLKRYYTTQPQPKEPEQEPVAWMRQDGQRVTTASDRHNYPDYETRYSIPLYTTPPQRTWVGLTDDDMGQWIEEEHDVLRWAEAKLKEKNT